MVHKFNVSEARTAIACPRVFYFDVQRYRNRGGAKRLTQLWTGSTRTATACGGLFHHTVEKFNRLALQSPVLKNALTAAATIVDGQTRTEGLREAFVKFAGDHCINYSRLGKREAAQQNAFVQTLQRYYTELAEVVGYAVAVSGRAADQVLSEVFSDESKRVDVTYDVGPGPERVNIRGAVDYIYFDHRLPADRIIDFKLTASDAPSKDLLQASLYALMHHQQHNTRCSAAVLYLFPQRKMVECSWDEITEKRHQLFDLLASMAAWADYNEQTRQGIKPPGEPALCGVCPWNKQGACEARLGPKLEGERLSHWTEAASRGALEPVAARETPPQADGPIEFDDNEEESIEPISLPESSDDSSQTTPGKGSPPTETDHPALSTTDGLYLGRTAPGGQAVFVPPASLNTHVAVLGAAGSGKSWLAKVIAEEAILQDVPVLAIDPQGDLVQFLRPATLPADTPGPLRQAYERFRNRVEVRIWTPGTSHGTRLALSPLKLPRESDLQGFDSPQRRREESDAMLNQTAGNLVTLAQAGGDSEIQATFVLELLRKLLPGGNAARNRPAALEMNEILAAMEAPDALGIDNVDQLISRREREKLKQKLYARLRGATSHLFSGGEPLDLERMVVPRTPGKIPLNIVYLNAMADDGQKQYFVAALATEIHRWMITTPSSPSTRLLLYLDEARDFLPAGMSQPPAKQPLLRLFAQGRKFGVGCLICTQSPRSVDYQAFSNASTKLIGRLEATQDVNRVEEWFTAAGGVPPWLPGRNGAERGTFVGRWPGASPDLDGQMFRSRPLYSLHEAAWSPHRVETEWSAGAHQPPDGART